MKLKFEADGNNQMLSILALTDDKVQLYKIEEELIEKLRQDEITDLPVTDVDVNPKLDKKNKNKETRRDLREAKKHAIYLEKV